MEATEARDEVVEAVLMAHGRDCRTVPRRPRTSREVPWRDATDPVGVRFYPVMDADARLTAELAADLDRAFDALVVAHQDRLYTIALRILADAGDAEEAVQDALVRAYRALGGYDAARIRELRLRGWLTTIVLNRCRSVAARRASRGPKPVSIDADPNRSMPFAEPETPVGASPPEVAERHAERERWAARLGALPMPYRTAIVLRHVDGMSYPEAAEALGRPEGTVKAQVHRGIALLRIMLEAEGRRELEEMTA
jgi:RNA polymerase sigma-70 factor (ECF subfamily)